MFQMKEQGKASGKDPNEIEISDLPNKELKIMVIKMPSSGEQYMNKMNISTNKILVPEITEVQNIINTMKKKIQQRFQ